MIMNISNWIMIHLNLKYNYLSVTSKSTHHKSNLAVYKPEKSCLDEERKGMYSRNLSFQKLSRYCARGNAGSKAHWCGHSTYAFMYILRHFLWILLPDSFKILRWIRYTYIKILHSNYLCYMNKYVGQK